MTTTTTVPGIYAVGIQGQGYLVDDREGRGVKRRSVPFLRNQADTSSKPGAQSLSPAGVWRRSQEDWSRGAGQSHRDREDSDPARFRSSKGVYVWDKWKLSLLPDTEVVLTLNGGPNEGKLAATLGKVFVADGNDISWTQTFGFWGTLGIAAGEAGATLYDFTTDGADIYAALDTNGVHRWVEGGSSSHYNDVRARVVQYVRGRLMAAFGPALYNVTAAGAAPAPLYTHRLGTWNWTAFGEGPTHIYTAGADGTGESLVSEIYKITVQPDGTALTAPSLAAPPLPGGERVQVMLGVANHIVVGTNKGVRLAAIGGDGNLTLGPSIPVPTQVLAAADRFVYFGWSHDPSFIGLGRLDLSEFTAELQPAYATDITGDDTATVNGVVQFVPIIGDRTFRIIFAHKGSRDGAGRVWASHPTRKVASGTLDSGDISYGITDDKVATQLDVSHETLLGSHEALLSVNGGAFTSLGTHTEGGAEGPFTIPESKGERFEVRHTLNRKATDTTVGPTLTRSTLSTYPTPRRPSEVFEVWLRLTRQEALANGNSPSRDPRQLLDDLIALEKNGTVIDFQLGDRTYRAMIEDHDFRSEGEPYGAWPEGSVGLTIRAI